MIPSRDRVETDTGIDKRNVKKGETSTAEEKKRLYGIEEQLIGYEVS